MSVGVKTLKTLTATALQRFRPAPETSISDFCDQYRTISPETAESPGPWRTDFVPYMREILECFKRRDVSRIILKWGIQLGKTEYILNILLYIFVRIPSSIMVVLPKKETAKNEFSAKRLKPMIRDCAVLKDIFPKAKRGRFIDTKDQKTYVGGSLKIVGTDATDLASTPVRFLFVDEVSKFKGSVKGEGDPFLLAEGRQSNFFDAKSIFTSSPAEEGVCQISRLFDASRQHVFLVPCPACGSRIEFLWEHMVWDFDQAQTARYRCQQCFHEIDHRHKKKMIALGEWVCTTPERSMDSVGYHLSSIYSPWVSWAKLTKQYIEARNDLQKGNEEPMRVFVNTRLAREYSPQTEGVDDSTLYGRREEYPAEVPGPCVCLTAGVDVNSTNIAIEVIGWGEGDESWSIGYRVFHGDPRQAQVWQDLEEYLLKPFRHEYGFYVGIDAVAVDHGFLKHMVESFVKTHQSRRYFAVKGERGWGRPIVGDPYYTKKGKKSRKVPLYPVCDAEAKVQVYSDLQRDSGPRACHFPKDDNNEREVYSRRFFQELTSERIKTKYVKGFPVKEWEKPQRLRNEPLDCRKYGMVARILLSPLYAQKRKLFEKRRLEYEQMLEQSVPEEEAAAHWFAGKNRVNSPTGKPRRPRKVGGSSWVKGW